MLFEALLLLALEPAGGQGSGPWTIYRGTQGLVGVAPGTLGDTLELHWTFEAGGAITSSPVVDGERIYFGSDDQHIHALDRRSGEAVWAYATEDIIEAPPLVLEGVVYAGSSDYFLHAIDARTGEGRWRFETDDRVLGSANWAVGPDGALRILVGSYDTHLYCLDAKAGTELWRYKTDNYVNGTPAILGEKVVFGGCDSGIHVVSSQTGERLAKFDLGEESYIAGSVGLADGRAYFGHYGNAFVCVDLEDGEVLWSLQGDQAFFSSPAITPDRVVFGGRDKRVYCVDRADGSELWSFRTRRKVDASPVVCGDRVIVGSGDGRMYLLDLEDGEELWSFEVGRSIFSSPAVVDGMVYVGANDGRLYAFGPPREEGR